MNFFSLRQQLFYFALSVSLSCDSFVSWPWTFWSGFVYIVRPRGESSNIRSCGKPSDSELCSSHKRSTSFALCFIVLLIFLTELKFGLSKIEKSLIITLTNPDFLLLFSPPELSTFPFITLNIFLTSSLIFPLKPSILSPSKFLLIISLNSKLSDILSYNK